ncbi:hypothetical protein H4R34_001512 [Dimargaris verticillata]|uniref:Uncharacterized protein n=1 Tax=Dimargaris verticillata TaxID=2761393 RepID=A0A9W8EDQ2_9FUNG|nr:hypothetical protein H4R34_001512 [Dimargaris verticillata]
MSLTPPDLTDARLFSATSLPDGLSEVLQRHVPSGQQPRRDPVVPSEPATLSAAIETLNHLVRSQSWRSVVQLGQTTLVHLVEPRTPDKALLVWLYRLLGLTQLGLYQAAKSELDHLEPLESSALCYEAYPDQYPNQKGFMAPWELLVLAARMPAWNGDIYLTLDRLHHLLGMTRAHQEADATVAADHPSLWVGRSMALQLLKAGYLLQLKAYTAALGVLHQALTVEPQNPGLKSAVGRLMLQTGNIAAAETMFAEVKQLTSDHADLVVMNRGFWNIAQGDIEQARAEFVKVAQRCPNHFVAVNNASVCDFYLGRGSDATQALETCMNQEPSTAGVCPVLIRNLCVAYELGYENPALQNHKVKKVVDVATWAGDGWDTTAFRLST